MSEKVLWPFLFREYLHPHGEMQATCEEAS